MGFGDCPGTGVRDGAFGLRSESTRRLRTRPQSVYNPIGRTSDLLSLTAARMFSETLAKQT